MGWEGERERESRREQGEIVTLTSRERMREKEREKIGLLLDYYYHVYKAVQLLLSVYVFDHTR